jgi:peptide chain release factor 1
VIAQLTGIREKFQEIGLQLSDPELISDQKKYIQLQKEYRELQTLVAVMDRYDTALKQLESAKAMLAEEKDPDFQALAKAEIQGLEVSIEAIEEELKQLLMPKDPEDGKNAVLEIRSGTGGDEAAIFAGDLWRMYSRFAEKKGWKMTVVDVTPGTAGGYKEVICNVVGDQVYGTLKFESGVHRVQRVPATETQGRIHTSAASVVVLPEAEEFDVDIKMNDIRKDTYCSSGAGGQSVNTTYSAVRLTHLPTGIVVQCQDERSQLQNFDKALMVLRSRIYEMELQKKIDEVAGKRKTMVSTGDRSAKIRTYNYPQSRITDHRIGFTAHNLPAVMNGDLDELLEALRLEEQAERLKAGEAHG